MMETKGRDLPYSPIVQGKDLVHKSVVHRNGRVAVYTEAEKVEIERKMSNTGTGMMEQWNFKMHTYQLTSSSNFRSQIF